MSADNRARAALRDFIAELNAAWEAAGPPSYARLEKLSVAFSSAEQTGGLRLRVLAASTTHEILSGKRRSLPEWGWIVSFVNVLRVAAVENGLDPDVVGTIAEWKARHQQARAVMRTAGPPPAAARAPAPDDEADPDHDHDRHRRAPPADRAPPAAHGRGGIARRAAGIPGGLPVRLRQGEPPRWTTSTTRSFRSWRDHGGRRRRRRTSSTFAKACGSPMAGS